MSYVTTNGWVDDATGAIKNVVSNAPTLAQNALSTSKQMIIAAKETAANVKKASANAATGTQRLNAGLDQWNKAKPFVYIGGAVLLYLVVRKLV